MRTNAILLLIFSASIVKAQNSLIGSYQNNSLINTSLVTNPFPNTISYFNLSEIQGVSVSSINNVLISNKEAPNIQQVVGANGNTWSSDFKYIPISPTNNQLIQANSPILGAIKLAELSGQTSGWTQECCTNNSTNNLPIDNIKWLSSLGSYKGELSNYNIQVVSDANLPLQYTTASLSGIKDVAGSDNATAFFAKYYMNSAQPTNNWIYYPVTQSSNWTIEKYQNITTTIYAQNGSIKNFRFDDHAVILNNSQIIYPTSIKVSQNIIPTQSASPSNGIGIFHNAVYKESYSGTDGIVWATLRAATQTTGVNMTLITGTNNTENLSGAYNILNSNNENAFSFGVEKNGTGYVGWRNMEGKVLTLNSDQIRANGSFWVNGSIKTNEYISVFGGTSSLITNITSSEINMNYLSISNIIGMNVTNNNYPNYNPGAMFLRARNPSGIDMDVNGVTMLRMTNGAIVAGEFSEVIAYQPNSSTAFKVASKKGGLGFPTMTAEEIEKIENPAVGDAIYNTTNDRLMVRGKKGWQISSYYPITKQ